VELDVGNFEALSNLGAALLETDDAAGAASAYRAAVALRPTLAHAHYNLALALQKLKGFDESISVLRQAIALRPEYAEAHHALGISLGASDRADEAIASIERALQFKPEYPEALTALGTLLLSQKRPTEAIEPFQRALSLRPEFPEALVGLGDALCQTNRAVASVTCFEQALSLRPGFVEAEVNLRLALVKAGRVAEAIALFRKALAKEPDDAGLHWHLGDALVLTGDYKQGWAELEWRRKHEAFKPWGLKANTKLRAWQGEPLNGQYILLWVEQGYGDAIQFARYASLIKQRGGRVILGCPPEMIALLSSILDIEHAITRAEDAPPEMMLHCSAMSVPHILGTTVATIPAQVPYLFPDESKVQHWQQRLSGDRRLKVGFTWQGRPAHDNDLNRSIPLKRWGPLAAMQGVSVYSLQKWKPPAGAEQSLPELSMTDWTEELPDFADTAAFVTNLDLVIAVDTAVAHLAGALGKPVWVMIPFAPDFRWMLNREDSPWYPTMRLFRQPRPLEWEEPIRRVANELAKLRDNVANAHGRSGGGR
jgi:tetratricopeptide (TPR) repeat protein